MVLNRLRTTFALRLDPPNAEPSVLAVRKLTCDWTPSHGPDECVCTVHRAPEEVSATLRTAGYRSNLLILVAVST